MINIRQAQFPDDMSAVQAIFREYVASPSVSLEFQDYEAEFAALPGKYAAPRGRLLLAWQAGTVVGCAAFREVNAATCEMKRVYVRPAARGAQLGRRQGRRLCVHVSGRAAGVQGGPAAVCVAGFYASAGRYVQSGSWDAVPGAGVVGRGAGG
jgi:GNAT superfamily N-acetyltransferase